MKHPRPLPAAAAPTGARWRLLGRWLLLLLIAFDLVSAPFHRHGHDLGAAGIGGALPHLGSARPAPLDLGPGRTAHADPDDLDDRFQLDSAPAAGFSHSQALLRVAETRHDAAEAVNLVLGLALLAAAWSLLEAPRAWLRPPTPTAPARRPPGLLPDGRAPPPRSA